MTTYLFDVTFSIWDYIASNDRMINKNELRKYEAQLGLTTRTLEYLLSGRTFEPGLSEDEEDSAVKV